MKKKHYLLFLLALLFLLTDVVWAQTSATVSGVVIDEQINLFHQYNRIF